MKPYNHTQSPLLAGLTGKFTVEQESLELLAIAVGDLHLPSGFLVITDPFAQMERQGNLGILLPKGDYQVVVTQMVPELDGAGLDGAGASGFFTGEELKAQGRVVPSIYGNELTGELAQAGAGEKEGTAGDENGKQALNMGDEDEGGARSWEDLKRKNVNGYVTVVVEPQAWQRRVAWSQQQRAKGQDSAPPKHALRYLYTTQDGLMPARIPADLEMYVGVGVDSGNCGLVDGLSLATVMPADQGSTKWGETIFDNGQDNSWFNILDGERGYAYHQGGKVVHKVEPTGVARIELGQVDVGSEQLPTNIIICESGYGDGSYPIIGEYAFLDEHALDEHGLDALGKLGGQESGRQSKPVLVAIHVSFQVVNEDVDYPIASNSGPRNPEFNS